MRLSIFFIPCAAVFPSLLGYILKKIFAELHFDEKSKPIYWSLLLFVIMGPCLISDISLASDDLCHFDSKNSSDQTGCGKDMDMEITEIKRELQVSIVQVKVMKRGTYAGSIMFQLCCFARIAKARGHRYFVVLREKDLNECKGCEWSSEHIVGFLDSKTDSIDLVFKGLYESGREYSIEDINELSMICGYLPIPSSEFLRAVYFGDLKTTRELAKKKKDLLSEKDAEGYQALHIATVEGHTEIIRYLVSAGADINVKGKWGWTPLHMAVKFDQMQIVKLLISLKADPAAKMDWGNTPLHDAAYKGSVVMASLFIDLGVGVDVTDEDGNTPLHAAASRGHLEMVKYLIAKGADPKKKNKLGQAPLYFAETMKHTQTADFLKKY